MFRETPRKGKALANSEVSNKYDEIRETMDTNPSFSHVEVAEKVFKSKSRQHVVRYGGGVKLKDVRGSNLSKIELQIELTKAKKANEVLSNHVETLEDRMHTMEDELASLKDVMLLYIKNNHSTMDDKQKSPGA